MKKTLLGTTALVTAGLLAGPALASDPLKVTVGGNVVTGFYFVDSDDINFGGPSVSFQDTKVAVVARNIDIKAEGTLDNGLVAGVALIANGTFLIYTYLLQREISPQNYFSLAGVIAAILLSASWKPGIEIPVFGVMLELQNLVRDAIIVALAFVSLAVSRSEYRKANGFAWGPIAEVAKLFAAIFICIVPVIAILKAGKDGALAPLVALVTGADGTPNDLAYFWLTGALSSFLDNAPTYLVFFELAGGEARHLMTELATTLAAISAGAVFMGANTYIGNAPNFMVYAIARHQGVRMPGFFGYMLWSGAVLIPTFLIAGFVFFR